MKKVFFTAIAMIAFSSASMANTIADEEVVMTNVKIENKVVITSIENLNVIKLYSQYKLTSQTEASGSIKCWAFGKWLKSQLVQANAGTTSEINQTVTAAVALCNVLDDLGWI